MTSDETIQGHVRDMIGHAYYMLFLARERGGASVEELKSVVGIVDRLGVMVSTLRAQNAELNAKSDERSREVETNESVVNGWRRFEDSVYSMTRGIDLWLLSGREGPLWELTLHGPGSTVRDRAMGFSLGAATASARRFVNDHYAKTTGPRIAGEDD